MALPATLVASAESLTLELEDKQIKAEFVEGEAIVKFNNELTTSQGGIKIQSIDESIDYVVEKTWNLDSPLQNNTSSVSIQSDDQESTATMALVKSDSLSTEQLITNLESQPNVQYAEPNYICRIVEIANDSEFSKQWGLKNTGQKVVGKAGKAGVDINVEAIWSQGVTGAPDKVVAVLDTGVDYNHEDLRDNMWHNPYKDDNSKNLPGEYGYDFYNDKDDPIDLHSHGTHCAGVLGAVGDNNKGISGVNKKVQIMALKFTDPRGNSSVARAVSAYEYMIKAKDLNVNLCAVNNSWAGTADITKESKAMLEAIDKLGKRGVISVCAAGNETNDNDANLQIPCGLDSPYIISVGAMDSYANLLGFSNYGRLSVDVIAPGSCIYSTILNNRYGMKNGTSMATPFITGSVALLGAYSDNKKLNWSQSEIRNRIIGGTVKNDSLKNKSISDGYFDLGEAIQTPNPVLNSVSNDQSTITINGQFFGNSKGSVNINGNISPKIVNWSDEKITLNMPNNFSSGTYEFIVKTTNNKTGRNDFTVEVENSTPFQNLNSIPKNISYNSAVTGGRLVAVGNYLYQLGGSLDPITKNNTQDYQSIYRYDINRNSWERLSVTLPDNYNDLFLPACVSGDKIYFILSPALGLKGGNLKLYTFDTSRNQITSKDIKNLPSSFLSHDFETYGRFSAWDSAMIYKNGKILIVGGSNIKGASSSNQKELETKNSFFTIDPDTATASNDLAQMPTGINAPQMHEINGKIFVVGQDQNKDIKTLIYNEKTNTWSYGADFPKTLSQQYSLTSAPYGQDKIIFTGMQTDNGDTLLYNTTSDSWSYTDLQLSPSKINKLIGVGYNNYFYAMGLDPRDNLVFKRTKSDGSSTERSIDIKIQPDENGKQNGSVKCNVDSAKPGDQVTLTAIANSGYVVQSVKLNGTELTPNALSSSLYISEDASASPFPNRDYKVYSFTMPDDDVLIDVSFAPNSTQNGFVKEGVDSNGFDNWVYYNNGIKVSGWQEIDGHRYYFNPKNNNVMQTGWLKTDSGEYYYFDVNVYRQPTRLSSPAEGLGRMHTGWANDGGNEWYYLDAKAQTFEQGRGKMSLGWFTDGGNDWYYCNANQSYQFYGKIETGWQLIDGNWYYFNQSEDYNLANYGKMLRYWQFINGVWYYFYDSGVMASNTYIDGYYIDSNGCYI